jgi:hypothetical protein
MTLGFLSHLLDISIRSVFLAFAVAVMLWISRNNKSPSIAHAAWTVVLCAMLSMFVLGPGLPPLPLRILSAIPEPAARVSPLITAPAPEVALPSVPGVAIPDNPNSRTSLPSAVAPLSPAWQTALICLYGSVSLVFLGRLLTGWWLLRRLLAVSRIVHDADANDIASRFAPHRTPVLYESPFITIPSTVGWRKPKILLPSEWRETGDPSALEWAQKHADVIFRFGRYPHRNAILGRASTPEEEAFLAQPGSRF